MAGHRHSEIGCPIETTLEVLGGKWKGMVLHRLIFGTLRFGELRRMLPHVTQRMLTRQLRELERDGVIRRRVYAEVPPRVEYSLSEFGLSLKPILLMMGDWGAAYQDKVRKMKMGAPPPEAGGRLQPGGSRLQAAALGSAKARANTGSARSGRTSTPPEPSPRSDALDTRPGRA